MLNLRASLLFLLVILNSVNILSIDFNTKKFGYIALGSIALTSGIVIFYKKNQKFRDNVKSTKEKTEDYFIDNIAVPIFIKWHELKELFCKNNY